MGHSNGVITAPVNTDDVVAVLGENSHDVKTLCMSKKINPWAKYKPEAINQPATINVEQRRENGFGIEPGKIYQSKSLLISAVLNETFDPNWKYERVGENDWGRLDDFVGYNHNATHPFGTLVSNEFLVSDKSSYTLVIPMTSPRLTTSATDDNGELNLKDFTDANSNYADWYVGLLLFNQNSMTKHLIATKPNPIKNGADWQIDFGHVGESYAGSYLGIPFISSAKFVQGGEDPASVKIVGLGVYGVEISLITSGDLFRTTVAVGYIDPGSTKIKYVVSIRNNSGSSRTISNIVLQVAKTNTGGSSMTIATFERITIADGGFWSAEGEVALPDVAYHFARLTTSVVNSTWVSFTAEFHPPVMIQ